MMEVAEVLHTAKSGRLILKIKNKLNPGIILFNKKGQKVVKVVELIGPVISPYASSFLLNKDIQGHIGEKFYSQGEGRRR